MSTLHNNGETQPARPMCKRCSDPAAVLVLKRPSATTTAFPYCSSHTPDPSEYGQQTTWERMTVIRRYDESTSRYAVYGRPGSTGALGRVMHIEDPHGASALCEHKPSPRRRYKLTHQIPDGFYICRKCSDASSWADDYRDMVVGRFLWSLRVVLRDAGELPDRARRFITYPRPEPRESHAIAEGGQST